MAGLRASVTLSAALTLFTSLLSAIACDQERVVVLEPVATRNAVATRKPAVTQEPVVREETTVVVEVFKGRSSSVSETQERSRILPCIDLRGFAWGDRGQSCQVEFDREQNSVHRCD